MNRTEESCVVCFEEDVPLVSRCTVCRSQCICETCRELILNQRCPLCRGKLEISPLEVECATVQIILAVYKNANLDRDISYTFSASGMRVHRIYVDRGQEEAVFEIMTRMESLLKGVSYPIEVEPVMGIFVPSAASFMILNNDLTLFEFF